MWSFGQRDQPKAEDTQPDAEPLRVLSFLPPEDVQALSELPGEAIFGFMAGEGFSVEHFRPNRVFIDFMHRVIRSVGPQDRSMQADAAQQRQGWLYVIDLRTPDGSQGRVPPEDIVGAFEVKGGQIIADSYWANDQHRVFTENGLVRLPPPLQEALIHAIKGLQSST